MSVLSDLQDAVAANTVAVNNLADRIAAIPTGGVDGGAVTAATAVILANNAKMDTLAVPAP